MRVQLLSFPGCPNVEAARALLRDVLAARGIRSEIEEIHTTAPDTPRQLRDWGSPTILVDGADVAGEAAPGGATCRLYPGPGGRLQGVPPRALIEAALSRAGRGAP